MKSRKKMRQSRHAACPNRCVLPNEEMIIGDKASFAAEIKFSENNSQMGFGKLWIQNQFYGTIEDWIYLDSYFIGLIEELLNASLIDFDYSAITTAELFDQLSERLEENFNYKISGSTFTDDFDGYKFRDSDRIYLIWQLRQDQPMHFDELIAYFEGTVPSVSLQRVPLFCD